MNHNQPHEPETKGSNKTRDFQDALARLIKNGAQTKKEASSHLVTWFLDASTPQQEEFMEWAAGYWWPVMEGKIDRLGETYIAPSPSIIEKAQHRSVLSVERKSEIQAKMVEGLEKKWLNAILPMTGAQVRAAKKLPDHLANQISDDQKVCDVFTEEQLLSGFSAS